MREGEGGLMTDFLCPPLLPCGCFCCSCKEFSIVFSFLAMAVGEEKEEEAGFPFIGWTTGAGNDHDNVSCRRGDGSFLFIPRSGASLDSSSDDEGGGTLAADFLVTEGKGEGRRLPQPLPPPPPGETLEREPTFSFSSSERVEQRRVESPAFRGEKKEQEEEEARVAVEEKEGEDGVK